MRHTNDISVIICAYTQERWSDLLAAIASVRLQVLPAKEIIVVSDHNPALFQLLQEQVTDAVIVENTGSRGLSGARNTGLTVSTGEIVAFLDDDAIATPHWLLTLSQVYADSRVLGVGGAILPLWPEARRPAWFPEEFFWVLGCTYRGMPRAIQPVRNLIGANMSFRREVFDEVGAFRCGIGRIGTLPLGCEETELCIRANQRWPQKMFLYHPQAMVYHHVPARRLQRRYFYARCYAEGLSKARITRFIGKKDGLSTERAYVFRTLLLGFFQALLRCDPRAALRAGAIVTGLGATSMGYLLGHLLPEGKNAYMG